jgi:hypothetical protein
VVSLFCGATMPMPFIRDSLKRRLKVNDAQVRVSAAATSGTEVS